MLTDKELREGDALATLFAYAVKVVIFSVGFGLIWYSTGNWLIPSGVGLMVFIAL